MSRNFYDVSVDRVGLIWVYKIIMPNGYTLTGRSFTLAMARRKATNLLISIIDHPAKGAKK
jgi:hypothetical protein